MRRPEERQRHNIEDGPSSWFINFVYTSEKNQCKNANWEKANCRFRPWGSAAGPKAVDLSHPRYDQAEPPGRKHRRSGNRTEGRRPPRHQQRRLKNQGGRRSLPRKARANDRPVSGRRLTKLIQTHEIELHWKLQFITPPRLVPAGESAGYGPPCLLGRG